jgi:hypothetical protein
LAYFDVSSILIVDAYHNQKIRRESHQQPNQLPIRAVARRQDKERADRRQIVCSFGGVEALRTQSLHQCIDLGTIDAPNLSKIQLVKLCGVCGCSASSVPTAAVSL